ncbi:MAG: hypothetical protein Q3X76_04525 [Akkermansia sp.]|nr:hypothetical protein [Akkermansia sp.]
MYTVRRSRKKHYGSRISLTCKMHREKKKWLGRNMSVRPHIHRLFDTYEKAWEAYQRLLHQSLENMLPEYLRKREWREQVDEHDYNAILLWREFMNIYDEVPQQSSLPLY